MSWLTRLLDRTRERFALWLLRPRAAPPALPPPPPPTPEVTNRHDHRYAVHECGHAIAAYCCTNVCLLRTITIDWLDGFGGLVKYDTYLRRDRATERTWCELVIALAGVAAEVAVYGRVPAAPARRDLLEAMTLARLLVELDAASMPWQWPLSPRKLPFQAMYVDPPTDAEVTVLEQAYQAAHFIVAAHGPLYHRLVGSLLEHRTLTQADVESLLGKRDLIHGLGLACAPNFLLPRAKKGS